MGTIGFMSFIGNVCLLLIVAKLCTNTTNCRCLGITAKAGQSALVFAAVFVVVWIGSAVVTLNGQVLGGQLFVLFLRLLRD